MKKQTAQSVHAAVFRGVVILLLFLSFLPVCMLGMKELAVRRSQKAFLGAVHRALPEQEAEIAALLYRTEKEGTGFFFSTEMKDDFDKEENDDLVREGEDLLLSLGYREGRLRDPFEFGDPIVWIFAILAGGSLGLLLFRLLLKDRRAFHEEQQGLRRELSCSSAEIKELQAVSETNQRLKDFIENTAHQLKTPLSRIITSLELLEETLSDLVEEKGIERALSRVSECTSHVEDTEKLVERLLAIGRLEAGEAVFLSEPFSLSLLSEELLAAYDPGNRPALLLIPETGDFLYHGSPAWIREALSNLINNAVTYGASQKVPVLTLQELPEAFRITLRDYGPGFSEADLPRLFDRFYRTQEMKKGHVGLGLNLAKLIIEGHKGRIMAENHAEGGALFTILLPKYELMKP